MNRNGCDLSGKPKTAKAEKQGEKASREPPPRRGEKQ